MDQLIDHIDEEGAVSLCHVFDKLFCLSTDHSLSEIVS